MTAKRNNRLGLVGARRNTRPDACDVCGAPAPITITNQSGTRHLCYSHEYEA